MKNAGRIAPLALGLLVLALATVPARADLALLDQAPANAPVVIFVPSLSQLSQKLATFNDAAGLGMPNLVDALGMFKQQIGATKGLKDDGAMMLVITEAQLDAANENGPPALLFLPTSDYAALVTGLNGKAIEPVTAVTLPNGRAGFARKVEGFAVMAKERKLVEDYQPTRAGATIQAAAGKLGAQYLATSDLVVFLNLNVLGPVLGPQIKPDLDAARREVLKNNPGTASNPLWDMFVEAYGDLAETVLRDSSGAVIGLDLTDTGIGITGTLQFKPGSYLAGLFTSGNDAGAQLGRLPALPYMFAAATNFEGVNLRKIIDDTAARLSAGNPITEVLKSFGNPIVEEKSAAKAFYVPSAGSGVAEGNYFNGVSIIQTADPAGYVKAYRDSLSHLNKPAATGGGSPKVNTKSTYTEGTLQLEGVKADEYRVDYDFTPESLMEMGQLGSLITGLGGMRMSGYVVNTGKDVIITTVRSDQLVRKAMASLREGKGLGTDAGLTAVRGNLTPRPSAEAYINVAGIIATINSATAEMGGEPTKVPADVLPIGASLSVRESGLAGRLFVPTATAKFTTQSIMPMVMMFAGPMMSEPAAAQPDNAVPGGDPSRPPPPRNPRAPGPGGVPMPPGR